jgi:FtsP/CotA-like multicopper oxidase with cupredoxin domain
MKRLQGSSIYVFAGAVVLAVMTLCTPALALTAAIATTTAVPVAPVPNPCARFTAGSVIQQPPALFSSNGVLNVRFSYQQTIDTAGRTLYCFMTPSGLENPTLHVNPGDTLNITVTNNTPPSPVTEPFNPPNCGDAAMTGSSMNIHYHGTNTSPACHGDNVTKTLINSHTATNPGTFQYSLQFPTNEPPGLYWYHPHVHGLAEPAVYGGAAGALVVDGIQNLQPVVAGMRQRVLVVRDQLTLQGLPQSVPQVPGPVEIPNHDLSVNFVPGDATTDLNTGVTSFTPAVMPMMPGESQLWRVCNCTSDTILDLQLLFDGVPQAFQIVGIDGVPVNSQDGTAPGSLIPVTHYRVPTAGRVEIIAAAPPPTVRVAQLVTQYIDTGPVGDQDPLRPLFNIKLVGNDASATADDRVGPYSGLAAPSPLFSGIASQPLSATRRLYFSEAADGSAFFITVQGQTPITFDNNHPPSIITTQGAIEKWIVQNTATENHEFHFHQIHFKVLSQDNFEVNGTQQSAPMLGQFADMIELPYWSGNAGTPYPDVQLLMDFRGAVVGDFVYHCHILGHEDLGMMAIIRVLPQSN